jgi:hypothetical protein
LPIPWVKLTNYALGLLPGVITPELAARRRFLRGPEAAGSAGLSLWFWAGGWVTAGSEFSKVSVSESVFESLPDSVSTSFATGTGVALILIGSI